MLLLYPSDPFDPKSPDENYAAEYQSACRAGIKTCLFSFESFLAGSFLPRPGICEKNVVCYRGWMMPPIEYARLCQVIEKSGATPLTSPANYELCHYLPRWYPILSELTPPTHFYSESDDIASLLRELGWNKCFLKDYVKSLSTDTGSFVNDLNEIPTVLSKMKKYRGIIEGGVCARQIEDFVPDSEVRYFVFQGKVHGPSSEAIPEIVEVAAQRIASPFFSVDTAVRTDEKLRIIELGDGQVSDLKSWNTDQFMQILTR